MKRLIHPCLQFLQLSQEGGDERGLARAHVPHHRSQRSLLHSVIGIVNFGVVGPNYGLANFSI